MTDHTAETANLVYTVQDHNYHNSFDSNTNTVTETFTPGPPDSLTSTVQGPAAVVAGSNNLTVAVVPRDEYGNLSGPGQTIVIADGTHTSNALWDATNHAYEATFTETKAGTVTVSASADGVALGTLVSTRVLPSVFDGTTSTIQVPASAIAGPDNVVVRVIPTDAYGNQLGFGQTVNVSDGVNTVTGLWNSAHDDYEAVFTEEKTGRATFSASVDALAISSAASTTIMPGAVDPNLSAIYVPSRVTASYDNVVVKVVPQDVYGNRLGAGQVVAVSDGKVSQTGAWNATNEDYETTFTETTAGTVNFSASVGGTALSGNPSVLVVPGPAAFSKTTTSLPGGFNGIYNVYSPVTVVVHSVLVDDYFNPVGPGYTDTLDLYSYDDLFHTNLLGTVALTWNAENQDYEGSFLVTQTVVGYTNYSGQPLVFAWGGILG